MIASVFTYNFLSGTKSTPTSKSLVAVTKSFLGETDPPLMIEEAHNAAAAAAVDDDGYGCIGSSGRA